MTKTATRRSKERGQETNLSDVNDVEADRPDPRTGKQAGQAYADRYAAGHRAIDPHDLHYRLGYSDILLVDSLLRDYRLLDVGCATAGYLRLLQNHAAVIGIDFSETTIIKARELQIEFGIEKVEFAVSKFEDYRPASKFDVVRLSGTFGAYQPWPMSARAIDRTHEILNDGGIAIASHYRPRSLLHHAKSFLLPTRTLAISDKRFNAMWESRGFERLITMALPHATIVFWRKGAAAPLDR